MVLVLFYLRGLGLFLIYSNMRSYEMVSWFLCNFFELEIVEQTLFSGGSMGQQPSFERKLWFNRESVPWVTQTTSYKKSNHKKTNCTPSLWTHQKNSIKYWNHSQKNINLSEKWNKNFLILQKKKTEINKQIKVCRHKETSSTKHLWHHFLSPSQNID